jgi:hypothetical protein
MASDSTARSESKATETARRPAPDSPPSSVAPKLGASRSPPCRGQGRAPWRDSLPRRRTWPLCSCAMKTNWTRIRKSISKDSAKQTKPSPTRAGSPRSSPVWSGNSKERSGWVANGRRGVPFDRDARFRLRLEEGPRRGQGGTDARVVQRLRGGLRPQAQVVEEAGLRASGVRTAEGEDAGRLKTGSPMLRGRDALFHQEADRTRGSWRDLPCPHQGVGPCPVRGFGVCRDNLEPPATTPNGPRMTRREGGRDRRPRDATVRRVTTPRAQ